MSAFLELCRNLWIIFLNSFTTIKYFIFGLPYVNFAIVLITAYFIFKMSTYETKTIKDPYEKIGRRRI